MNYNQLITWTKRFIRENQGVPFERILQEATAIYHGWVDYFINVLEQRPGIFIQVFQRFENEEIDSDLIDGVINAVTEHIANSDSFFIQPEIEEEEREEYNEKVW